MQPTSVTVMDPGAAPQMPDWLTEEGRLVWIDDVGRAVSHRMATEADSMMFANYCNLQGAIIQCWKSGNVPPMTSMMEARRMAELFGLGGRKSRVIGGDAAPLIQVPGNPFANNGRRR